MGDFFEVWVPSITVVWVYVVWRAHQHTSAREYDARGSVTVRRRVARKPVLRWVDDREAS